MPPILKGILFGFIFLFAIGPAFFALIQTSIERGLKRAILLALGISFSDMIYVIVTLFGMAKLLETENFKFWMAVFGSLMLTGYAVYSWMKEPKIADETELDANDSSPKYFFKGLLLNGLNPFIIVSWATWISAITIKFEYGFTEQLQFFVGMLITILSLDLCKAFIANRLKHLITVRFIRNMNRIVAVILVLFTTQLVYFLWENYA
jgi:threonine/homoserine/homoserine lactone efflux protein